MEYLIGTIGRAEDIVREEQTARHVQSGALEVFSTPSLAALMERAAVDALAGKLGEGQTSVGTRIDIRHTAATPVGMRVFARAEITAADERTVHFHIAAEDAIGPIGEAAHTRAIVDAARFMKKAEAKQA